MHDSVTVETFHVYIINALSMISALLVVTCDLCFGARLHSARMSYKWKVCLSACIAVTEGGLTSKQKQTRFF